MKTGVMVCDAMTRQPLCVPPQTTIAECAAIMKEENVGSLLIKDGAKLLGILTEQDIVRKAVAQSKKPAELSAADIMEKELVTMTGSEDILDALALMSEHDIRHLPIVNNGELAGFLTMKDVLRIEPALFDLLVDRLDVREEESKLARLTQEEGVCQQCGEYAKHLHPLEGTLVCSPCSK